MLWVPIRLLFCRERIKIASVPASVLVIFLRSVLLSTAVLGSTAFVRVRDLLFPDSLFYTLHYTCPYLGCNTIHLQHTLIQDVDLMFLDVGSPLGAVIGRTTWHTNITFPSHPSLSCRQLTPVSGATKAEAFIFPVSTHPLLSTEPPSFHKLKVE